MFHSFFTLTNPLGTMPVFLTMTNGMNDHERKAIVRRAMIVSLITLMVFTFSGQFLFKFFGISSNGFRIAGGFIIFKIGFDMLQARYSNAKLKEEEVKTYADDISITPLAIPMLCGPGAIANAIMLSWSFIPLVMVKKTGIVPSGLVNVKNEVKHNRAKGNKSSISIIFTGRGGAEGYPTRPSYADGEYSGSGRSGWELTD